jgi:hypothetical protein
MSLPEFQAKESPFQKMHMELQDKGSVLSKAWADLFSFITKYQAELTVKENAVQLAEKEIDVQKKQFEEMKPISGTDTQSWQVVTLQEECLTKERLLNQVRCKLNEKERELKSIQLEFNTNKELFEESKKELQWRNTQLMLSKQETDHHASQSRTHRDELEIKNSLVQKFKSQLLKQGMENAKIREQLEKERKEHAATKRKNGLNVSCSHHQNVKCNTCKLHALKQCL